MPNENNSQPEENNNLPPEIDENEMKMPEQNFGPAPEEPHSSTLGAILVALIVILLLILGGLYLWGSILQNDPGPELPDPVRPTAEENNEPESTNAEADVSNYEAVSTSDEIDAIEADLESTDMEALDAEMMAIEAELDAAIE